ncbi:MAG: Asp-tRNA(Asn)/Glu-tRNA(Gln) amidotransferase subunit GatC [Acidobacteria bacterium]|nr:Asp-tRNA(Asn)/Glu-tRNA(Gln) amidotransferase subunit GatC [Acidobacteriota bacterium]
MKITEKEVRYIADLANVSLSDDEVSAYQHDLEEILTYVEKLGELDTEGVQPMSHVLFEGAEQAALRQDALEPSFEREEALDNAPLAGSGHFKVPLVIER